MQHNQIVWGGLQEHQVPRMDGISPSLTAAMGMGGGQTPIFIDKEKSTVVDVLYNKRVLDGTTCETITANGNASSSTRCGTFGIIQKGEDEMAKVGQISSEGSQCGSVYSDDGNSPTLTAETHGDANSRICTEYRIRKLTAKSVGD